MYSLLQSLPYGFRAQLKVLFSPSHLQNAPHYLKKGVTSILNEIKVGTNLDTVLMVHYMSQIKTTIYIEDNVMRDTHTVDISTENTHNHTCEACYTFIAKQSLIVL